jgi:hypothetical protein
VASHRGELAAARVAATALRGSQLRERLSRLRAGIVSTHEDVAFARASAANQRAAALRAQERLLRTYAAAADADRSASATRQPVDRQSGEPQGGGAAREQQPRPSSAASGPDDVVSGAGSPEGANLVLRHALASIAAYSDGSGGQSKDRRQQLWQELTDQCGRESWQGWSHALCRTAPSMLPALRGLALTGYDAQGCPRLLAASDEWTRQREETVELVGEGPAVQAYRTGARVLVPDLDAERARWPGYVSVAAELGVTAVAALPVQLNGVALGSLTLYPVDQGEARIPWESCFFLATVAAQTLLVDLDAVEQGWPLPEVADPAIQVAVGVLAVQLEVSVEEAFARLRAQAFSHGRRLAEVAHLVLEGAQRPPDAP